MHRRIVVPNRDRRPRVEDARKRVAARPDFFGVEHPRGRSLGAKSVRGVGDQENQAERREHQAPTRSATVRKDGRGHRHGRRQARTGGQGCADPVGRVDHPNTPSAQQVERERAEERKRIEKEKLAITTRHRILATILESVSAPLKKADLLAVAQYLIGHLAYSQVPTLAKRHRVEAKKDSESAQELLAKQVSTYDEAELCKLVLEVSLLDSAYQRSAASRDDVLMDTAKCYRVDTEKLQK